MLETSMILNDLKEFEFGKFIAYNSIFLYYFIVDKFANYYKKNNSQKFLDNNTLSIVIKFYNLIIAFISCFVLVFTIFEKKVNFSLYSMSCVTIENSMIDTFYYIKYVEWMDTIFLIMKNKTVTSLHYYHHMIVPLLVYVNMGSTNNGGQYYVIVSNSLAHTLMYFYYAYPIKFKKYAKIVTSVQTVQHFGALLIIINQYVNYTECNFQKIPFILGLICYIYFFVEFFKILVFSKRIIKNKDNISININKNK